MRSSLIITAFLLLLPLNTGCTSPSSLGTYQPNDSATETVDEPCVDADSDGSCVPTDCVDSDPSIHPGAWENDTDGVDNNCNNQIDEFTCSGDLSADCDSDGYTLGTGDCLDDGQDAALINPSAIEDLGEEGLGDEVDNDCDGLTDELPVMCDCTGLGKTADELARAVGLCDVRFYSGATLTHSAPGAPNDTDSFPAITPDMAVNTIAQEGTSTCLQAQQGCEMAVMASGPLNGHNSNVPPYQLNFMGQLCSDTDAGTLLDPLPEYQDTDLVVEMPKDSCDRSQLRLELRAPANALGFSFDFVFGSSEIPENQIRPDYNDTFYAIMEYDGLNGGARTNIAFDDLGREIAVKSNYFENSEHVCDEAGSVWSQSVVGESGTTGWLRTTWPVEPGDDFVLTFSVHDEGDYSLTSVVFIDNWQWLTVPVEPETVIITPVF